MFSQNYPSPGLMDDGDGDPGRGTGRAPEPVARARGAAQPQAPVLIVEDEQTSRTALSRLLRQSGYANRAVASGEEAMQVIRSSGIPRVALVDLNLPGMSGFELIERLSGIDPSVMIVLTTAAGGQPLLDRVSESRVEYLRKPLDFDRLLGLLGGTQASRSA